MSKDALVLVGTIVGAFGVKGELRLKSFTRNPKDIFKYAPFLDQKGAILFEIKSWREIKDGFAFYSKAQITREQAMLLRNTRIYVPREKLPLSDEDEFYYVDLIGLEVFDLTGAPLGKVRNIIEGSQELLEIENHPNLGRSWLLPFTLANVPIIDVKGGKLIVDVPDGLIE